MLFRITLLIRHYSLFFLVFILSANLLFGQDESLSFVSSPSEKRTVSTEQNSFKLLTWNLHLLPAIVMNKHQKTRARGIGKALTGSQYDVIVFQEAFHKRAQNLIWRALSKQYPYQYRPQSSSIFKYSSGVWIISKLEIKKKDMIAFFRCNKGTADCRARKGALLIQVEKGGKQFQIIGTHLQAKEGRKFQEVRDDQLKEIKELLIAKNKEDGTPIIVTGDMNIAMAREEDYQRMLSILGVENGELSGDYKYTSDHSTNDMYPSDDAHAKVIDYVLLNKMGANIVSVKRAVKIFRENWRKKSKDLSDHFAVEAEIYY